MIDNTTLAPIDTNIPAAIEAATASVAMVSLIVPTVIDTAVTMIPLLMAAASHTGGTVARSTEVTTVPTVVHTYVITMLPTVVVAVSVIVAVISMTVPGMGAAIGGIEVGTSEVEVVTMWVAEIDAKVPVACLPVERAVEIAGCHKGVPLPVVEDIAQVEVTTLPIGAEHVCTSCDTHEVVEIDLVCGLILLIGQIQLVRHLVSEEQGLIAGLLVTHCFG